MKAGTLPRILLLAAAFATAVPVDARAPTGTATRKAQYLAFDGETTEIVDNFTTLTWQRKTEPTARTYAAAELLCTSAAGWNGRLPTVKELLSIVDEDPHLTYDEAVRRNVRKAIDQDAFGSYTAIDRPYWTSTPAGAAGGDEVWAVSFADGTMERVRKSGSTAYVRCVR